MLFIHSVLYPPVTSEYGFVVSCVLDSFHSMAKLPSGNPNRSETDSMTISSDMLEADNIKLILKREINLMLLIENHMIISCPYGYLKINVRLDVT